MAYLGIVEAVLARLQGKDKSFVPTLPELPQHIISGSAELDSQLRPHSQVNIARIDVPIYHFDPSGRDTKDIRPCFTFDVMSMVPRYDGFVFDSKAYQGDYAREKVQHSKTEIADVDAEGETTVLTGTLMEKRRAVMHPYDVLIEIQAIADDDVISALMVEHVYHNVFNPRDFIRVPMKDGSYRSWDVIFQDFKDLDSRQAVRAGTPGVERSYAKVWTYKIEGFLDNTDRSELVNVVRSRRLTLTRQG